MNLERDGACHLPQAVAGCMAELDAEFEHLTRNKAGLRISGFKSIAALAAPDGAIGGLAATWLGPKTRAVRALLFDKTAATNWSLGWHQDRTIAVRARREVLGFGPWTVKNRMPHVSPPFDLLACMLTLRVHLDSVNEDNAPLLVAPGSHLRGRIPEHEIDAVVERCGIQPCLAERGDAWLYSTPILHASRRAANPSRRRVLQIDYCAEALPGGLEWLGV